MSFCQGHEELQTHVRMMGTPPKPPKEKRTAQQEFEKEAGIKAAAGYGMRKQKKVQVATGRDPIVGPIQPDVLPAPGVRERQIKEREEAERRDPPRAAQPKVAALKSASSSAADVKDEQEEQE